METNARRASALEGRSLGSLLVVAASLAACSETQPDREFSKPREVETVRGEPRLHASAAERFALQMPSAKRPERGLSWTTPQGWSERTPTSMRVANFQVAGNERAECYLTLLSGDAGGLAANVNRWCTQISRPALTAAEIDALPRCELLGREAVLLDLQGTWNGMSGADRVDGQRLVGALLVQPEGSAFLKMVGPADVLAGELEHFKALARSLRSNAE